MKRRCLDWIDARFPLRQTFQRYFSKYLLPNNLNFYYCFGALAVFVLLNQAITGVWLTMFYTPTAQGAFDSIQLIMRDVHWGWLLRTLHTTGASAFFMVLYLHIFRGLLYGSYQKPRELVWLLGMVLFILLMAQAFFGYLLPYGQLSYWGAQVLTSFLGVIPFVGETLMTWFRGDYVVSTVTLQRFFALHVVLIPALVFFFVFVHVVALHHVGSNNPEGIESAPVMPHRKQVMRTVAFYPYYFMKDVLAVLVFLVFFLAVVFFIPEMGGYFLEPLNLIPANPLLTPEGIRPLWYLTPFYTMLRSVPNQGVGVFLMLASVMILFFLPWLDRSPVRSMRYKGLFSRMALALMVLGFVGLGCLGMLPMTPMRLRAAQGCMFLYFSYFCLMPIYTRRERCKPLC